MSCMKTWKESFGGFGFWSERERGGGGSMKEYKAQCGRKGNNNAKHKLISCCNFDFDH